MMYIFLLWYLWVRYAGIVRGIRDVYFYLGIVRVRRAGIIRYDYFFIFCLKSFILRVREVINKINKVGKEKRSF